MPFYFQFLGLSYYLVLYSNKYQEAILINSKKAEHRNNKVFVFTNPCILCPKISLFVSKTTVWKEFVLLHQTELIQRELTNGVVLGTSSIVVSTVVQ